MTLQASGAIGLSDVQGEFGGSWPIDINEYYGRAPGIPGSGVISLSDFYGKSNAPTQLIINNAASGSYAYMYANNGVAINGASGAYAEDGTYWWFQGYPGNYWTFAICRFNLAAYIPANATLVGIKVFYKASIDVAFNYQVNDLIFGNGSTMLFQGADSSLTALDGNNVYRQYISGSYPDTTYGHTYGLTMANVLAPEFGVGLKIVLNSGNFYLDNMAMHIFYR